jgi:hypothetical protein
MMEQKRQLTTITRRRFIASSTAAAMPLLAWRGVAGALWPGIPAEPWYARMRRCGQINVNEKDPLDMDVEAWADYWASLKVDAVLLGGGGIVAFYPTNVPYHHRSQYLGSRDLFGELVRAMKKRGIRVVARMDCNYAYEDALRAHPEWFQRRADGSPVKHNESTWLFKTCMFSSYFTEQMPAIYREINQNYPVDGFFTNGWPSTGALETCHCENCQKLYREKIGGVPPDQTDATNQLYRKYHEAFMTRVTDIWKQWQAVATDKRPDSVYVGNLGGGIRTVKNLMRLGETAAWFNADHQGRSGDTPVWDCAAQGRLAYSVMKGRTVTNVTGAYSNSRITWRHVAKSPAETTIWMAQTVASGMTPWFHWLGGSPEDNRWREAGRSFFNWLAANEAHFRNKRSIADLAVLYPQSTIAFYKSGSAPGSWRGADRVQTTDYLQGLYYALLEGRFLFDFIHEDDLASLQPGRYRALLIPNAAYLSDRQCDEIKRYAEAGGSVWATFETSVYNEWGDRRSAPALAGLFGARVEGDAIGPLGNSYMRIERQHPITAGFEGTSLLPGAENRLRIRAIDSSPLALSVVPYYPAFPPEMVYPRTKHTDEPAALFKQNAASRTAYFAGDIDRTFWRSANTDLGRLISNSVTWVLGDSRAPVSIEGEGVIEAFAWQTEPGYALHLLNYTNPNMTRGVLRQFYPIGRQKVLFEVAAGRKITGVRALRSARALSYKQTGRRVQFEVPSVLDYEVIALT